MTTRNVAINDDENSAGEGIVGEFTHACSRSLCENFANSLASEVMVQNGHPVSSSDITYSSLSSIPRDILANCSNRSQAIRESLLSGSKVVFVCSGFPTKRFIYEIARDRGISAAIIDNPDSWADSLQREGVIDHFVPIDMSRSPEEVLESAVRAIEGLSPVWVPDGICTFVELAVELTSRLGKAFGLPHSAIPSIEAVRDKSKTRSALKDVEARKISTKDDLREALKHIGFPGVIKPVSGAASLCVQRFDSLEEAFAIFDRVREEMVSSLIVSSGALGRKSQSANSLEPETSLSAHSVITTDLMVEEYLDGPEVDVDIIMSDGECQYANVIDNGPTFEPFFAETWAAVPSLVHSAARVAELTTLAIKCLKTLELTDGIFHVELKFTSRGPRLIEINARMGGGPTRTIHQLVAGVDLVLEQLLIAVGIPSRPPVSPTPLVRIGYAFINARTSGYVESVEFMEQYKDRPFVVHLITYIKPFEICCGPKDGLPTWLGEIVVAHQDGPTALALVQAIEQEIADDFSARCIPV